jgi:glycosyltransferase 2 family protein
MKGAKWVLQWAAVLLILAFLVFIVYTNIGSLETGEVRFDYSLMALSLVLLFPYFILLGAAWNLVLRMLGGNITNRKAMKIWLLSQIGTYIPGKIWAVLGRVYLCQREGISKTKTSLSIAIELLVSTMAGIIFFVIALVMLPYQEATGFYLSMLVLVPAGLVVLHPRVFNWALQLVSRKMKMEEIHVKVGFRSIVTLVAVYGFFWALLGVSAFFLINSMYPVSFTMLPAVIGIFAFAWLASFFVLIAPGGIGVREGVAVFFLSFLMPPAVAVIISLVWRVWFTVAEVLSILALGKGEVFSWLDRSGGGFPKQEK